MSLKTYPNVSDWLGLQGGRVTVHTGKVDIGQRISTALARIAATELGLHPDDVDVAGVRTGAAPDEGITSGSNSLEQSGHALRCAAATLRAHLLDLAANRSGVNAGDLSLRDGRVCRDGTDLGLSVADLMAGADPELCVDPAAASNTRIEVPRSAPRGMRALVTGQFRFVHDLEPDGTWHARVVRPPQGSARLRGIDAEAVERTEGEGMRVIRDGSLLAVAGQHEWPVMRAAQRLARACDWDDGGGLREGDVFEMLRGAPTARLPVIDGSPARAELQPEPDAPDYDVEFERPYTMHGALGPSAALAEWRGDRLVIHCHSQGIYPLRDSIAKSLGVPLDAVEIAHAPGSGCYGHNGADDAAFEAALIARVLPGTPVLLKWSREDEHAFEPYGTAMSVRTQARLADDGTVALWSAEVRGDTHRGRPRPGPDDAGPKRLLANRLREDAYGPFVAEANMGNHAGNHRNLDPIYSFADRRLVKTLVTDLPLRVSALRCLGAAANVFAIESAMDELAERAGADPLEYRRRHLDDPRALAILDRLSARMAEVAPGESARGVAYSQYKNAMTRVGVCVDLQVTDAAEIRLDRAILVADAGRIVDPDGLTAQLEGGFLQAASWALHEQVTWDRDGVQSRDWDGYPVLRFNNVPEIEVILLDRPDAPSVGAGEASPPPTLAAIANAVAAATGLRLRRLPFTPEALTAAALAE